MSESSIEDLIRVYSDAIRILKSDPTDVAIIRVKEAFRNIENAAGEIKKDVNQELLSISNKVKSIGKEESSDSESESDSDSGSDSESERRKKRKEKKRQKRKEKKKRDAKKKKEQKKEDKRSSEEKQLQDAYMSKPQTNSLTSPADRTLEFKKDRKLKKPLRSTPLNLSPSELTVALAHKYKGFPEIESSWIDPDPTPKYYLISFCPAKGASPDKDGFFGFAKVRGAFDNDEERDARAELLIQKHDSYHEIYHGKVGHPFPICTEAARHAMSVKDVDISKKVSEVVSSDVRSKVNAEKIEMEEIKKQEKNLLQNSIDERNGTPVNERYIELAVKRSNQIYCVLQAQNKVIEYKRALKNTVIDMKKIEIENPGIEKNLLETYTKACGLASVPVNPTDNVVIRYMIGDIPFSLDEIDISKESRPTHGVVGTPTVRIAKTHDGKTMPELSSIAEEPVVSDEKFPSPRGTKSQTIAEMRQEREALLGSTSRGTTPKDQVSDLKGATPKRDTFGVPGANPIEDPSITVEPIPLFNIPLKKNAVGATNATNATGVSIERDMLLSTISPPQEFKEESTIIAFNAPN